MKKLISGGVCSILLMLIFACNSETNSEKSQKKVNDYVKSIEISKSMFLGIQSLDSLESLANEESLKMMNKLPDSLLASYFQEIGMLFYGRSLYDQAEDYFIKSEHFYQKANLPQKAIKMVANRAVLKELKGDYEEAIGMYLKAAKYFSDAGDSLSMALVYTNIGVVYQEMNIPEKSLQYNRMGLNIKLQKHDTLSAATNYNNIGVLCDELLGQPDSALLFYQKAVVIYQKYKAMARLASAINNVGRMHLELKQKALATDEFNRAYQLMDSLGSPHGKARVLRNQGELYFSMFNNRKAIKVFHEALSLFRDVDDKKSMLEITELISRVYMADGNFAKAAEFMKAQNQLKDTLMNNESKTIIAEMETRFQVREKNKTIHLLELQDELNRRKIRNQVWVLILLIIISLLIMAVFIFSYNRYKLKDKQLRLELQNYLLRIDKLQNEVKEKVTENKFSEDKLNYYQLSEREVEVLNLIASGYKNAEIAEQLFVSQNTIKTHIKNIYVKLDVKNRIEALKKVDIV